MKGILGVAVSEHNEIFLNRTNLSPKELEMGPELSKYFGKSAKKTDDFYKRLERVREAESQNWEDAIWHEVAHVHDKFLGYDGKFLSEMPGSPFGKKPWASEYAESTGKPSEDFAEPYAGLLRERVATVEIQKPNGELLRMHTPNLRATDLSQFIRELLGR